MSGKMLKQNALTTLQNRKIKMQQKISVLQYTKGPMAWKIQFQTELFEHVSVDFFRQLLHVARY